MQKFYFAVLGGDKLAVANYVYYPFVVNIKHKSITLRDQTEFLRYYDKIFTKKMIKIFKNDVPHDLNSIGNGGILFLSGTVWFNLDGVPKIININ
jgi:hypothetical protein